MSQNIKSEKPVFSRKEAYQEAGADHVISNLVELKLLIDEFIYKLARGERP